MQDGDKMSDLEKKSLSPLSTSFLLMVIRYSIGGIVYATASFFAADFWNKWKSKNEN